MDGAPSELAVTDLTPAGRRHAANLADRIRREVVMQHEGLFVGALERIDILLVLAGAERGDGESLGLAPGKERAAMGAGKDADLAHDRSDRCQVAPVDAPLGIEDARADDVLLGLLEGACHLRGHRSVVIRRNQRGHHLLLDRCHAIAALLFGGDHVGLAQPALPELAHARHDLRRVVLGLQLPGLLGGALGEFDDGVEHGLELLLPEHYGAEHDVLGQFLGFRFDHQHGVGGAGHDEVERAFGHLVDHRVEHVFAGDIAHARRADRAQEGDAGQGKRGRGGDHRHHVGVILHVVGEHGGDDLRLVLEA